MQTATQPIAKLTIDGGIGDTCLLTVEEITEQGSSRHTETCDSLQEALRAARLHRSRYESHGWDVRD